MAIYSLNLKSIGRTTHAAGTAGAHLRYIARADAKPELAANHMPTDPAQARTWMDRGENADRKNARVVDKVRIALPRELTPEQRMQLVRDFASKLTQDRVPWFAAIHAQGKDAHNPHCHLVIRDRDIETGKRVVRLSDSPRDRAKAGLEPKAVEAVRALWERTANDALERAGSEARIDRRSLDAQGIDREPTIHIGPQAQHIDKHVHRPQSKIVETGQGREIDYPMIDAGRTRKERHAEIVDLNIEKAARSPDFVVREQAKLEREQRALDRTLENRLIVEARQRTLEQRRLQAKQRAELQEARQDRDREMQTVREFLRNDWRDKRKALTERHAAERDGLRREQGKISARFMRFVDVTGRTRARQEVDRADLKSRQGDERRELVLTHQENRRTHSEAVKSRYDGIGHSIRAAYQPQMRDMRDRHLQAEQDADKLRQQRAAEREAREKRLNSLLKGRAAAKNKTRGFDVSR